MDPIKVEVFLSVPACSGGVAVRRLIDEVASSTALRWTSCTTRDATSATRN